MTPSSVTIASTSAAGVTSNTGFHAPAPSADSMTESQREAREVIDKASKIQPDAQATGQDKAQAQKNLDAARSQLEAAKQVREGDRQGTASGGSRLKPAYTERVEAAEKQVQEAEQRVK